MAPALELLPKAVEALPAKAVSALRNGISDQQLESPEKHDRVMKVFRAFIADVCQQYGEGHVG